MRKTAVIEWLAGELQTHVETSSLVSIADAGPHVDIAEDRDAVEDRPYPFIAITPISNTPHNRGIGNDITTVAALNYNDNIDSWSDEDWGDGEWGEFAVLDSIDRAVTRTLRVTVTVLTDGDRKLRSDLTEDIQHDMGQRVATNTHPTDIEDIDVGEATPSGRPEQFVYGDGIPIEIEYERIRTDSDVTAAEAVSLDIDVGDDTDDPNAADAISESV